jgi:hypothetical protein
MGSGSVPHVIDPTERFILDSSTRAWSDPHGLTRVGRVRPELRFGIGISSWYNLSKLSELGRAYRNRQSDPVVPYHTPNPTDTVRYDVSRHSSHLIARMISFCSSVTLTYSTTVHVSDGVIAIEPRL